MKGFQHQQVKGQFVIKTLDSEKKRRGKKCKDLGQAKQLNFVCFDLALDKRGE